MATTVSPCRAVERPRDAHGLLAASLLVCLVGCSEDSTTPSAGEPPETPETEHLISFAAQLGGATFSCGRSFDGIGATNARVEPLDLRAFVHGFETQDASGTWVPLQVVDVERWQAQGVALLDFASPETGCPNAGSDLRREVLVRGPVDALRGVRFVLGVPFENNHRDPSTAPAPLSSTAMHWSWQAGYKFLRFDITVEDSGPWLVHLGSTGCEGPMTAVTGCAAENRVAIELADWTPDAGAVVMDLDTLLADADVRFNTPDTATGCMSSPTDPECDPIFAALGLGEPGQGLTPSLFRAP
jgi:uncharacterized repeat protein (TIGR04052 family)